MSCTISDGFKERTLRDNAASTEEDFDLIAGQFQAVRQFVGPWANRYDFINNYIGIEASAVNSNTVFVGEAAYPDNPIAYAARVHIKGEGKPSHNTVTEQAQYERAVITVTYTSRNYNQSTGIDNDPVSWTESLYLEEEADFGIELLSIPGNDVLVGVNRQHDKGPFNIPVVTGSVIIRQHQILRPRWNAIDFYMGKVNSTVFITPSRRFLPAGTLRYDGLQGVTKVNLLTNGVANQFSTPIWTLTHKLEYNREGWNNKFIDGVWQAVLLANGQPLFPADQLFNIFFDYNSWNAAATINAITALQAQLNALIAGGVAFFDPLVINIQAQIQVLLGQLGFN